MNFTWLAFLSRVLTVQVYREFNTEFADVIVSGEFITTLDWIGTTKYLDAATDVDLLSSNEVLSVGLARLVEGELSWQFLPSESYREGVFARVWEGHFSNLDSVIG